MQSYLIRNISIVNEGKTVTADLLIKNGRIEKIAKGILTDFAVTEINGEGKHLLPGVIDDQVHFREPGLTHKATIYTEAKAAVAGGVTSFMEMPNTIPPVFTQELLEDKYAIGARSALANYSFYMGTSNDNAEEALVCFDEALAVEPNNAEALVKKGTALERLRKLNEAIECYDRAIAADNSMTIAYLYKGGLFNRMERFGEALECYEMALKTQEDRGTGM